MNKMNNRCSYSFFKNSLKRINYHHLFKENNLNNFDDMKQIDIHKKLKIK